MTLDEYLAQFIEGYLLEDLRSMGSISPPANTAYGAVGYPMVMTAMAGIEVLGVLTSKSKFSAENGSDRFGDFWRHYVYVEQPALQRLHSLVYQMVRHGLAHAFLAKPMIRVTKHRDPNHLRRVKDGEVLILDALTLADDFATAYGQRLRPRIVGEVRATMETRFNELREAYWRDHIQLKSEFDKAPLGTETSVGESSATHENSARPVVLLNGRTRVNSPSISRRYTNISTSGFDDPTA
jgi:hypothetical protein